MWVRVAFTALARSSLESIRVPSRSKISSSIRLVPPGSGDGGSPLARAGHAARRLPPRPGASVADFVLHHFSLQRVAVDAELLASFRLIVLALFHGAFDHPFLQQRDRLGKKNMIADQILNEPVKFVFHASPEWAICEFPFSASLPMPSSHRHRTYES